MRAINISGHEVKVGDSVLAWHATRVLAAIELAKVDPFAAEIAALHARLAADEALKEVN